MDDLVRELHQFQRYVAGLQTITARARAGAPDAAEGSDSTGKVRVVLDAEGIPRSVVVGEDWARRLAAASLATAVTQAFQAATGARMSAWSQRARDEGWRADSDRLRVPVLDRDVPVARLPADVRQRVEDAPPRSLDGLTDDVLTALRRVDTATATSPSIATGRGSPGSGRLAVVVSRAGLVSCTVDAKWATRQSGSQLTAAFGAALAMARAELIRAAPAPDTATAGLDQLFAQAMATLMDPDRLANS
jgi:hypothetical protein